jgi:hypothetical protein
LREPAPSRTGGLCRWRGRRTGPAGPARQRP